MELKSIEPLILTESDILSVAPSLMDIIGIVEDTYAMDARGEVEVPAKIGVHPDYERSFLHAMPAWVSGARALGMKWISYFPGMADRGYPDSSALIVLNDPDYGLPVAIMAGMWVTYARTTACAAVAARHLAKPNVARLGLVGCGGLGTWSLNMLGALYPDLQEVYVASGRRQSREDFCARMAARGSWKLTPVDNAKDAVADMDIVVSSTPHLAEPPVKGEWWNPGTLAIPLDVLSGWDDEALGMTDRLVTDGYPVLSRFADPRRPDFRLPENWSSLADVVAGKEAGWREDQGRVMAIPTGVASTDMTLGWEIYRRAEASGIGTRIKFN